MAKESSVSSFSCEKCGSDCIDTPNGYITGCEHYPITAMGKRLSDNEPFTTMMLREQEKLARIGGRPCEWSPEQWADWNEGKD